MSDPFADLVGIRPQSDTKPSPAPAQLFGGEDTVLPGPAEPSKAEGTPRLPHTNSMSFGSSGRAMHQDGDRSPIGSTAKPGSLEALLVQMTSTLSQKLDEVNRHALTDSGRIDQAPGF